MPPRLVREGRILFLPGDDQNALNNTTKFWNLKRREIRIALELKLEIKKPYPPFPGAFKGDVIKYFIWVTFRDSWNNYRKFRTRRINEALTIFLNSPTVTDPTSTYSDFVKIKSVKEVAIRLRKTIPLREDRVVIRSRGTLRGLQDIQDSKELAKNRLKSKGFD